METFSTEAHLLRLIQEGVPEKRQLDYKADLKITSDQEKFEFAKDVSSFANAAGGSLIFGIAEDGATRKPATLQNVALANQPNLDIQLRDILNARLEPKVSGLEFLKIPLSKEGFALVIRIPNSWNKPHMVKGQQFWMRDQSGKRVMDVVELRSAFLASESIGQKMRDFVMNRLALLSSDNPPNGLCGKPVVAAHILPISAFSLGQEFDLMKIYKDSQFHRPITDNQSHGSRYNFDGVLTFSSFGDNRIIAYNQFFRSGIIEITEGVFRARILDRQKGIPLHIIEDLLLQILPQMLRALQVGGASMPAYIQISILGIKDMSGFNPFNNFDHKTRPCDKSDLLLPETLVEEVDLNLSSALRPTFDALWNAFGISQSPSYKDNGQRRNSQ